MTSRPCLLSPIIYAGPRFGLAPDCVECAVIIAHCPAILGAHDSFLYAASVQMPGLLLPRLKILFSLRRFFNCELCLKEVPANFLSCVEPGLRRG